MACAASASLPPIPCRRGGYDGNMKAAAGQTLLIDADDTLWENNIYFERAIAAFISFLDHQTHSAAEIREVLNQTERASIAVMGYGLASFTHSLIGCYEKLSATKATEAVAAKIRSFAQSIADQEMELMPGVAETLPELASRHRLILMTKGATAEQAGKLERSGLAEYFSAVEIVPEKNVHAYEAVMARHGCECSATWMIGNSPKSDINPALAAGLHAVFLVHKDTWVLEHAELSAPPDGQRLIELDGFARLVEHF